MITMVKTKFEEPAVRDTVTVWRDSPSRQIVRVALWVDNHQGESYHIEVRGEQLESLLDQIKGLET